MFERTLAAISEVSAAAATAKQSVTDFGDTATGVFEGTWQEELDRFIEQIKSIPALLDETGEVVFDRIDNLGTIVNSGLHGPNGILAQMSSERIGAFIDQQFSDVRAMFGGLSGIQTDDQKAIAAGGYSYNFGGGSGGGDDGGGGD